MVVSGEGEHEESMEAVDGRIRKPCARLLGVSKWGTNKHPALINPDSEV
jgi:hypothetical protein